MKHGLAAASSPAFTSLLVPLKDSYARWFNINTGLVSPHAAHSVGSALTGQHVTNTPLCFIGHRGHRSFYWQKLKQNGTIGEPGYPSLKWGGGRERRGGKAREESRGRAEVSLRFADRHTGNATTSCPFMESAHPLTLPLKFPNSTLQLHLSSNAATGSQEFRKWIHFHKPHRLFKFSLPHSARRDRNEQFYCVGPGQLFVAATCTWKPSTSLQIYTATNESRIHSCTFTLWSFLPCSELFLIGGFQCPEDSREQKQPLSKFKLWPNFEWSWVSYCPPFLSPLLAEQCLYLGRRLHILRS